MLKIPILDFFKDIFQVQKTQNTKGEKFKVNLKEGFLCGIPSTAKLGAKKDSLDYFIFNPDYTY